MIYSLVKGSGGKVVYAFMKFFVIRRESGKDILEYREDLHIHTLGRKWGKGEE